MSETHVKKPRLAAAASFIGSTLEYYDFFLYGAASALVFNKLFFPSLNPALGTLASLGTFAIGYIGRPIGAAVIGHYGDKIGRKQMLVLTLIAMGVCTFLIGCLPTYNTIGIAAPIGLLVLRLFQGLAVSGESGGATTLSLEHAPDNKRAFYASWVNQGAAAGSMLSSLVFLGFSSLPTEAFLSWGWRIPFLLSAVVVVVGVIIRRRLPESPEFEKVEDQRIVAKLPLVTVLTKQTSSVLRVIGIAVLSALVPIVTVFALSYGVAHGIPRSTMLIISLVTAGASIATQPIFALLSDRYGRKPLFITGGVIAAAAMFIYFQALSSASIPAAFVGALLAQSIGYAMCNAVTPALYAEMFDTRVRYTGVAVSGQLGQIFPGFAPAIAAAIIAAGGDATTVCWFIAGCCAFGILVLLTTRETRNVATDALGGLRRSPGVPTEAVAAQSVPAKIKAFV